MAGASSTPNAGVQQKAPSSDRLDTKGADVPTECLSPQTQTEIPSCAKERLAAESPFARPLLQELSLAIEPFGYSIFQAAAAVSAPTGLQPVGPDYVLGPDDEFTVTVWGQVDGVYKVKVNREGEVVFPRIGAIAVAGITFGEFKNLLLQAFAPYFKGTSISVAMGQLRSMQVFMVGEVQKPGSYVLGSLSTTLTALFAAGGVTKNGTLRDIHVVRSGKVVAHLALYQFLLKGDKSQDVRLQDQDAVFVPLVGTVVGVAGHVLRPAIYEVKTESTLGDVLNLAGGVRPTGYLTRVQIERIAAHERRVAVDLNLSPAPGQPQAEAMAPPSVEGLRTPVQNMDMVKVFPISPVMQQVVYLRGNVPRPGPYELKSGMRITDVVHGLADLLPDTYLYYARVLRYIGPELAKQTLSFNLQKAFAGDGSANVALQPLDEIEIYAKEDLRAFPSVSVAGEVRKPGIYPLLTAMRISDLIVVAGGLQKLAYQKDAELTRYTIVADKTSVQVKPVNLEKAIAGDLEHDLELQELDQLAVRPIPESEVGRSVTLQGEVQLPGPYSIKRGERLSSVLKRAGGLTERAFPQGLVLIRESGKQTQQAQLQRFVATQRQQLLAQSAAYVAGASQAVPGQTNQAASEQAATAAQLQLLDQLSTLLAPGRVVVKVTSVDKLEGTLDDVLLELGDQITIPQQPIEVMLVGAVRNSTSVVHRPGLDVEDYIQQAGGMTQNASKSGIYIVRADGSAESRYMSDRRVNPGDTIVMPQVIEAKTRPLQLWQAVASIVGSAALVAAGIAVVGR